MEVYNTLVGTIGLVLSIWAFYLAYISYINPMIRLKCYLRKIDGWEKFIGIENEIDIYRYKKYPQFQIVIHTDKPLTKNFFEEWMNNVFIADKDHNESCFVTLEANGMVLDKEVFVCLDGYRHFVPVPRIMSVEDRRFFYYDSRQIYLAQIIGRLHFDNLGENIFKFADDCGVSINMGL